MTPQDNDRVEVSSGDAASTAGTRGRTVAIVGAVAVLLMGGVIWTGTAVARNWGAESSAGAAPARAVQKTTAAPMAEDPYKMASNICGASQAVMARWVIVAQNSYPDAEGFANFLGHEADVIDQNCPSVRTAFDAATWAAVIRLGPSN